MTFSIPKTLSLYLCRLYGMNFLFFLGALLGVIYLFDTVELMRRAGKFEDMPVSLVLQMSLFKLPEVGQIIFPFAVLFSAMFTLWQLGRRHELVIFRASGLSAWQFLAPLAFTALLIGFIQIMTINPMSAIFIGKYEMLERTYLDREDNIVTLSEQGLWLRQDHDDGKVILHAAGIQMPEWILKDILVLFFDKENNFSRRIDAESAVLGKGRWTFSKAVINKVRVRPERADAITLATDLTIQEIEEGFLSPSAVSFWKLPSYITTLQTTGFDTAPVQVHFQSLLSQPLLYVSMVLLAAAVSLRPPRVRGNLLLVVGGLTIGFLVFFSSSFLQALGVSHQIPILLAAWSAPLVFFLCGLSALLTLEDG